MAIARHYCVSLPFGGMQNFPNGFKRIYEMEVEWGAAVERRKRASECATLYRKHLKVKTTSLILYLDFFCVLHT